MTINYQHDASITIFKLKIICFYSIDNQLEKFCDLYFICSLQLDHNESITDDENKSEDNIKNQLFKLLLTIQTHSACHLLLFEKRLDSLYTSFLRLNVTVAFSFEIECLLFLLKAIHDEKLDEII